MRQPDLRLDDIADHVGEEYGPGNWITLDQRLIDEFATATGDDAWYHVDTGRARDELPDGVTIAHGLLTLSLVPKALTTVLKLHFPTRAVNYGYDRIRFPAPVQVNDRIRFVFRLNDVDAHPGGILIRLGVSAEIDGDERPALVATQLILAFDSSPLLGK